jgi:hypothetical protein
MAYNNIPTGPKTDEDVLSLVMDRKRSSIAWLQERYNESQRWNDAFRGIYTGNIANYLNEIVLPLTFATVMSHVARLANSIFGSWPIVSLHGFAPGSEGIAKKNELLINMQLKECDSFRKAVQFFTKADIDGTAVAEVGWSFIQRMQQFRTYVPGTLEQIEVKDLVTSFDGPQWRPRNLQDFYIQDGKTHIKEADWYIVRDWVDFDSLLELNSGDGLQSFRPDAIKRLAELGGPQQVRPNMDFNIINPFGSFGDFLHSRTNLYAKPVELITMYGLVPSEFAPDGIRNRVITVANGMVVLRNDPDKLLLNRHRIIHYSPTPDPDHFVGISKAKIVEPLQSAASRLTSQKLDALDLANRMPFLASAGAVNTQNMFVKPGKVFQVNTRGKSIAEAIMPLPINLQPLALAFQEIAFLDSMAQKGTGMDERSVMGLTGGSGNEVTAREALITAEGATTRLALEAMIASSEMVEPLAELFRDMNKTMLPLPKQFTMIGTRAVLNYITGMPLPAEEAIINNPAELNHGWQAKAFGPTFMLTKTMQRADAMQLAQMMMSNPVWIQNINWIAMARKLFGLYDWDADEMLVQVPQLQALAQQMGTSPQGAVQAAGSPTGGPGGASGQTMAPVQRGAEPVRNAPLGVGP